MADVTLDTLLEIKDSLFDAAYDDSLWGGVLGQLKAVLGGSSLAFGYWGERAVDQSMIYGDCMDGFEDLFFDPVLRNPFIPAFGQSSQGSILIDTSLMPKREFHKTLIYNEWFVPQGEHSYLHSKVLVDGDVGAHLGILRGGHQPEFGSHDIAVINQITPVLGRVAALRRRVGALRLRDKATAYDSLNIGFAAVGASGRILHSNAAMDDILARPTSDLTSVGGMLTMTNQMRRNPLYDLIARTCGGSHRAAGLGGDIVVASSDTGVPSLAITVAPMNRAAVYGLPMARAAMVFVQDLTQRLPVRFEERVKTMFGLTTKEAALTAAIASGYSLQKAADMRGITITTARTQLSQVFRKTSTSQQSQLVSLVLSILPIRPEI